MDIYGTHDEMFSWRWSELMTGVASGVSHASGSWVAYELIWNINKYKLTWIYDTYYRLYIHLVYSIIDIWFFPLPRVNVRRDRCYYTSKRNHWIWWRKARTTWAWAFHDANFGSVHLRFPSLPALGTSCFRLKIEQKVEEPHGNPE